MARQSLDYVSAVLTRAQHESDAGATRLHFFDSGIAGA
jgi:hypothetical protein